MQIVANQEEKKYSDEGINQIIKTNISNFILFLFIFHYFEFL